MSKDEKSFTSVGINWYSGNMIRAKRLISENVIILCTFLEDCFVIIKEEIDLYE